MTDEERWIIQGRTRESLKKTKETAATLRADLLQHARKLIETGEALAFFANDPAGTGPTGKTKAEYLLHFFGTGLGGEIVTKINELATVAARVAELEKQISEF